MKRTYVLPRKNWEKKIEELGLTFHQRTGAYWNEDVAYVFGKGEIDSLEKAGNDVHQLCLDAIQKIIEKDWFGRLKLDKKTSEQITASWKRRDPNVYGRFDFLYDGTSSPKMIEYNADTPTSLLEASVIQWKWFEERFISEHPAKDQFNLIHESLVDRWKQMGLEGKIHFTTTFDAEEDIMNTTYLRDTATEAGFKTKYLSIDKIGIDKNHPDYFLGVNGEKIKNLFKLYPWEWLLNDENEKYIPKSKTKFIEPIWKMLLSNKGILPILWELNQGHPNLLPAFENQPNQLNGFVRKPYLGREGQNVTIFEEGAEVKKEGVYGEEGFIYQAQHKIKPFSGKYTTTGIWIVGDEAVGMGIREDESKITDNYSKFTPHYFE